MRGELPGPADCHPAPPGVIDRGGGAGCTGLIGPVREPSKPLLLP